MRPARQARYFLVFALLLAALCGVARAEEAPELLLEVRLGQHLLSDGIGAFQQGPQVLLPLGELARLLTISIHANPAEGYASGVILDQQRGFQLDLHDQVVVRNGVRETYDAALVRRRADDIYIAASLLSRWLPVDLDIDLATLTLKVRPREKLPLQARLERLQRMGSASAMAANPGYPRVPVPYRMARIPFADQTLAVESRRSPGKSDHATSYSAYVTGDLLGTEAALYINRARFLQGPQARLTIARNDPDAALLGPLRARTVQAGSVASAAVPNIALGSAFGNGMLVSNRALGLPAQFDRHNLQGDLPPGWDVELFFNDALIGVQPSRSDGRYSFENLPLNYGANEFRLVFHGPLGQTRVERRTFLLEQSMMAPGQLDYTVSVQRDERGGEHRGERSTAMFDWGVGKRLTASAALVRMPLQGEARSYASVGVQSYLDNLIVSAAASRASGGGSLAQIGVKTRIYTGNGASNGALALAASRSVTRDFVSEFYLPVTDQVRTRDEIRVDGALAGLPVAVQARRERLASGRDNLELNARVSAYRSGTAISHGLRWQSLGGRKHADGQLQVSRRMAGVGISGQLHYAIEPDWKLATLALSADKHLAGGYLVSGALTRTFDQPRYRFSAALNKSLGRFGMGVNGWYSRRGEYGAGLQLFMATGRDPGRARWMTEAAPMAGSGNVSLRVFLDKNRNGVMDGADMPIPGVGFLVNGATVLARTGEDGVAWIGRLTPNQHADITLDPATLEDPQWHSALNGMRIVPRPGSVGELDFAVHMTGEIDGTTWLEENGARRAAGELELELIDGAQAVVARTVSSADGYFVIEAVAPGAYALRITPAQLKRLGLRAPPVRLVHVDADANFVNGQDLVVTRDVD